MDDHEPLPEPELTEAQKKAIDLLYAGMVFWYDEGIRLIKQIKFLLEASGDGRTAAGLANKWRDVDDRWIDIAAKLAPYQSSRLSSTIVKKEETRRFVIEVPSTITDKREWLEKAQKEQALLPKPVIIDNINRDNDAEDINEDVNGY